MRNERLTLPGMIDEQVLYAGGFEYIAGVDEAGRGALAGPVVAAAVILPKNLAYYIQNGVRDSKKLNHARREVLFELIKSTAIGVGIGIMPHHVIDEINILNATRRAMRQALDRLSRVPDYVLVDGMPIPRLKIAQKGIIKGDCTCISIASASIIAKVTRDRMMQDMDIAYPGYGFGKHKGYGTRQHLLCLSRLGPTPVHRYSFAPVRNIYRII
jgi:ribonuclease HII